MPTYKFISQFINLLSHINLSITLLNTEVWFRDTNLNPLNLHIYKGVKFYPPTRRVGQTYE